MKKPELMQRTVEQKFVGCPDCGKELITYYNSYSDFNVYGNSKKCCGCKVWHLKEDSIGEYLWVSSPKPSNKKGWFR